MTSLADDDRSRSRDAAGAARAAGSASARLQSQRFWAHAAFAVDAAMLAAAAGATALGA